MDRLAMVIKNRLVLSGESAFEAPYLARDAIALAHEIGIAEEGDIVRLAIIVRNISPLLLNSPSDRDLVFAVLRRLDMSPSARLNFIERTWLSRPSGAQGG